MNPHSTAIQTKSGTGAEALVAIITSRKDAFAQVAPKHFSVERLVKLAHASLSRTPGLAQCTPTSVLVQLMRCAELGLEPNSPLGGMHLVPFKNRRTNRMECQGIIDYRALVALARRSDQISAIAARVVYSNDRFTPREDENGVHFEFVQAEGDAAQLRAFVEAKLGEGLASGTVRLLVALLSSLYVDLVERGIVAVNPARGLPRSTMRLMRSSHDPRTVPSLSWSKEADGHWIGVASNGLVWSVDKGARGWRWSQGKRASGNFDDVIAAKEDAEDDARVRVGGGK